METGKRFKPKSVRIRGAIKEMVGENQMAASGKVDFERSEGEAAAGVYTRRLVADPPGGFLFTCVCGHPRRVTGDEMNFFCEWSGWNDGKTTCSDGKTQIEWKRKRSPVEGEVDEAGEQLYEDVTEQETMEFPDPYTGKMRKTKIDVPVFEGRYLADVRKEEFAKRKAAGQEQSAQPTNTVNMLQRGMASDGQTPGDRVKQEKK
jgi:hypothetical protein